jgi:hypothetical protein
VKAAERQPTDLQEELGRTYRRFAEGRAGEESPLHARVALALGGSPAALDALSALPTRGRSPALVLAALHYLALKGRAPSLADAYAAGDQDAAASAAVDALVGGPEEVAAVVSRRQVPHHLARPYAVLHPAIGAVARRVGAGAVGLVDVGSPAGLNLLVDGVSIAYSDGRRAGEPASPVASVCRVVGERAVPTEPIPAVVARVAAGTAPFDAADADDALWLRACLAPDDRDGLAALAAELALASAAPPRLVRGDLAEAVPRALDAVPPDALPVVITTWSLSRLAAARRGRFLERLEEAALGRPVAWVAVEGVGVAPSVPTLGDRPASGHSIVGLAVLGPEGRWFAAAGRCWSRGRVLEWLGAG